jgi:phosphoheptose isomerase
MSDPDDHVTALHDALAATAPQLKLLDGWAAELCRMWDNGGRLLVAGNGGSAAEAQHLTAELMGRYSTERRPLAALALHVETSTLTAVSNDYGFEHAFARQVEGLAQPGDVLLLLSTSGCSANLLTAADAGRSAGAAVWAMTGPLPNPLAAHADQTVAVSAESTATVQEVHLVLVHLLSRAVDECLAAVPGSQPLGLVGGEVRIDARATANPSRLQRGAS